MNDEQFTQAILSRVQTLYRVTYTQLPQLSDQQDAVQEALRRAWEKRLQLRSEEYLQTWLIRILLNVCHDMQKQQKRVQPKEYLPLPAADSPKTETRDALLKLDEKLRLPIILHYLEGYSIAQTARMLRCPEGTVKTRLTAGKKKLRELLNEEVFGE